METADLGMLTEDQARRLQAADWILQSQRRYIAEFYGQDHHDAHEMQDRIDTLGHARNAGTQRFAAAASSEWGSRSRAGWAMLMLLANLTAIRKRADQSVERGQGVRQRHRRTPRSDRPGARDRVARIMNA